ncbi:hypothetical protein WAI453_011683 [Rhynchosporium graminicola]
MSDSPIQPLSRLRVLLRHLPQLNVKSAPSPLTKYTLFPKLPFESRRRIIAFAAHEPRKVMMNFIPDANLHPDILNFYPSKATLLRQKIQNITPAILHVSYEFRAEGLRYYTLCEFDAGSLKGTGSSVKAEINRHIYVIYGVDHFHFALKDWWSLGYVESSKITADLAEVLSKVKYLDWEYN